MRDWQRVGTQARRVATCAAVAALAAGPAVVAQDGAAEGAAAALYCEGLALLENYGDLSELGTVTVGRDGYLFGADRDLTVVAPYEPTDFHFIRRLADALSARGTNLVVVLTPPRGVVLKDRMDPDSPAHAAFDPSLAYANYSRNIEVLREAGAIAPNLLDAVTADPAQRAAAYLFDDFHWSPVGAALSAEAVAEAIRGHPDYGRLTPRRFTLDSRGMRETFGVYSEAVDEVCGVRPPSRSYEFFTTRAEAGEAAASSDLLADAPADESADASADASGDLLVGAREENIVLVGTSFSRRNLNDAHFPGLLAHHVGAFVDNRSVSGGALETTMEAYLRSRDFRDRPPPFLVWEFAPYFAIDGAPEFFRAIIPAVFGECAPGEALASGEAELAGGGATVISTAGGAPVPAERSFLFMEVDDLSLVKFTLEIEDASGFVDRVPIDRSTRVMNDGRFFMELLDLGAPVVEARLAYQGAHSGRVAARVCQAPADVAPLY